MSQGLGISTHALVLFDEGKEKDRMLTPQEIQERAEGLEKAVFGGYTVSAVDTLLEEIGQDYEALSKENAVLKSRLKVLVEKLEEYRTREESINRTLLSAQQTADDMVSDAQRKSAKMLADYEQKLRARSQELKLELSAEQERVTLAKQVAARFITQVEERVQAQLATLEKIRQLDLKTTETPRRAAQGDNPLLRRAKSQQDQAGPQSEDEAARQIEENLSKLFEEEAPASTGNG